MVKRLLIVVDMQKDFLTGSLANPDAVAIVPGIKRLLEQGDYTHVIFTQDTHYDNYLETLEGQFLPIKHCISETEGWEITPELINANIPAETKVFSITKETFGWDCWKDFIRENIGNPDEVEATLVGTCTDICVISNALALKPVLLKHPVIVLKDLCAASGVKEEERIENTEAAFRSMRNCQIKVL